jgi:hypothetical protein
MSVGGFASSDGHCETVHHPPSWVQLPFHSSVAGAFDEGKSTLADVCSGSVPGHANADWRVAVIAEVSHRSLDPNEKHREGVPDPS